MSKDIRLSKHFMLSEFLRSSKAAEKGINNNPNLGIVSNLQALCDNCLEPLREHFNTPIVIGSGYRCPELNEAVAGVAASNHIYGYAADIHLPDEKTGKQWFLWMMDNLKFDELLWEKSTPSSTTHWIHIAFKQDAPNRQKVVQNLVKHPNG